MSADEHWLSRQRMRHLGLRQPPACGACAEWIFCGTVSFDHMTGCKHAPPDESDIQWHVERVADKFVSGDPAVTGLLHFDITSHRAFVARVDGEGPLISVTFDENMKRATIVYGDDEPTVCSASAWSVANSIDSIRRSRSKKT